MSYPNSHPRARRALLLLALVPLGASAAESEPTTPLASVLVEGQHLTPDFSSATRAGDDITPQTTVDTASLVRDVPGAALNFNGPLAGQVQYRGLFGPRNTVSIDGMHINPGGPNWMDPPLHYLPRPYADSVTMIRGIAPVAAGIETLGGVVVARSRQQAYGDSRQWQYGGSGSITGASVDDGLSTGVQLGAANDTQRADLGAVYEHGQDARYGDGRIADSGYERRYAAGNYGLRHGASEYSAHLVYDDTRDAGNPTFPMDTEFLHTAIARLGYRHDLDNGDVSARLYYIHVHHAMNNYSLRETPDFNSMMDGPDQRRVPAKAYDWGFDLARSLRLWGGQLQGGVNAYLARNSAVVTDPQMAMFRVDAFDDAVRNLYSAYGQWQGTIAPATTFAFGTRYTHTHQNVGAGGVAASLPAAAQMLAQNFAAADRSSSDNNVDVMTQLQYALQPTTRVELTLARKTRSPSYLERDAYIPLETTGGASDGNNYVGNLGLKPEVAYEADLGLAWQQGPLSLTPRVFYSRIHDYIQGVAVDGSASDLDQATVMVSTLNGDSTPLRYENVGAKMYGADLGWQLQLATAWQLGGAVGYTRGKRTDTHDNLYRVAPLHGDAALRYAHADWGADLETVFAAAQHHVSAANHDPATADAETAGWAIVNVAAHYRFVASGTRVQAGVSNVFDRDYADALNGYNRVQNSDLAVGERLPGYGRNVYLQLTQSF
ncbi:TonB-dependent receptor plug domain-containing protein [Solimonas marina]|uniref:TonB-dependent receptor n=1 Tax=Solimonas marina TaxID=2714601 RepID=A0A969WDY5_9GAMM|nr:TonB-dependent receptor [Solimonas marina]NKF24454.1 TonB-dependent receptor [Solimonas marina]